MEIVSLGGSKYFILFVDDCSRMTCIYFLKNKNEAFKFFQQYKAMAENQTGKKIKFLRSDNGLEFCNKEFDEYLNGNGIIHQKTNPYTPEQNGLCERMNRTVVEKARCLLFDAKLDRKFWAEAANTAVYLHNRTISSGLDGKTPYEIWRGVKPDVSHLRIFGSTVMVHVAKEKRTKWDKKSNKCILVGFPENIKGYRVYDPETRSITTSRDVVIIEKESTYATMEIIDKGTQAPECEDKEVSCSVGNENIKSSSESSSSDYEDAGEIKDDLNKKCEDQKGQTRPQRIRKKPVRYGFESEDESANIATTAIEIGNKYCSF